MPDTTTVTWVSMTVVNARRKPASMAARTVFPSRNSSRMRSKMRMLVSTAMPIVSTMPAMPGNVSVAWNQAIAARRMRRLSTSARSAIAPDRR